MLYGNTQNITLSQIGKSYSGILGKNRDDFGEGKPFITYLNIYKNIVVDETLVDYVKINKDETQNRVQYGDALFTMSSETPEEVGMSAVYFGNNEEIYLNSFCFGYRLNDFSILHSQYMPYCFSSTKFRKFIFPFAQGSTRFNLQKNDFMNKYFTIPTIENQIKIFHLLKGYSDKLQTEYNTLSVYKKQKAYFIRKLFI
jgi:type I restriction enzyme S subunit